jgi:hypothetical protein
MYIPKVIGWALPLPSVRDHQDANNPLPWEQLEHETEVLTAHITRSHRSRSCVTCSGAGGASGRKAVFVKVATENTVAEYTEAEPFDSVTFINT